jgi:opacity protein-like surface antigen
MEAHMFRRFGFIMAAALIAAAPAAAQDERPVKLTIGGGFTGVYGSASDHIGNGGNFTLGVLFKTSETIALQGEYAWNGMEQRQIKFPVSPTVNPLGSVPTDFFADANMQYGSLNMLFSPKVAGKTAPYGITGLGVYYRPVAITTPAVGFATVCDPYWYVCYPTAVPVEQVVGSRSSTDFGMNFGGGINFQVKDNFSIFFEIRYHYIWGPTIEASAVPTQPIAGVDPVAPKSLKANGQFLPITLGFRF